MYVYNYEFVEKSEKIKKVTLTVYLIKAFGGFK